MSVGLNVHLSICDSFGIIPCHTRTLPELTTVLDNPFKCETALSETLFFFFFKVTVGFPQAHNFYRSYSAKTQFIIFGLFVCFLRLSRTSKTESPVSDPPRLPAEEF